MVATETAESELIFFVDVKRNLAGAKPFTIHQLKVRFIK
jgi:hypothetical protein